MSSPLIQLIYASAAVQAFGPQELADLLKVSHANNARLGLTGMLLYAEGSFFQVLEGETGVVEALYGRIEGDPRHTQVTQIICEPIPRRSFDSWTMGFYRLAREELAGIAGINDFFDRDQALAINTGRARKLLGAFRDGRWRKKFVTSNGAAPN
jgi:hypothetical protein